MSDPIEDFSHAGMNVRIYQDTEPMSPLEWDNLGTVVAFDRLARHYREGSLYDRGLLFKESDALERRDGENGDLLERYLRMTEGAEVIFFYFADYGSSGARLYATDNNGASGFIYVDRAKIISEYGDDSPGSREQARSCLRGEIETLGQYVEGDVWGYIVDAGDGEGDFEESVWGFYGLEYATEEAKSIAEFLAREKAIDQEPDLETTIYRESR